MKVSGPADLRYLSRGEILGTALTNPGALALGHKEQVLVPHPGLSSMATAANLREQQDLTHLWTQQLRLHNSWLLCQPHCTCQVPCAARRPSDLGSRWAREEVRSRCVQENGHFLKGPTQHALLWVARKSGAGRVYPYLSCIT